LSQRQQTATANSDSKQRQVVRVYVFLTLIK
jgi:hypothetical protein